MGPSATPVGRLVGREPHLAAVEPLLLSPRAAGLTLVEVTGAPGIGKTALLHELQARAERHGLAVRAGRASELGRDLPYGVVRQALGDDVLGPVDSSAAAGWTRYRLWERVRASVEDLGRGSGVLLCLDDVHWADAASTELVTYLLRQRLSVPVVLVLAYRPHLLPVEIRGAAAQPRHRVLVELSPLSEDEALAVLSSLESQEGSLGGPRHRASTERACAESGGNPLYLLTLARGATAPLGTDLRGRIHAEVAALPADARCVARAAAVLGDPVDPELLPEVADLDADRVAAAVDLLVACEVLHDEPPGCLTFRHPLVARAAYEETGPAWRAEAHGRAVAALTRAGAPLAARAHHCLRSARRGDQAALTLLRQAADETVWQAPVPAAQWFGRAAELVPEDQPGLRHELVVRQATALGLAGQLAAGRAALHSVLARLPRSDPLREHAVAMSALLEHLLGRHDEAAALLQRELEPDPEPGPDARSGQTPPSSVRLRVELAAARVMQGRWEEALDSARRAVATPTPEEPALRAAAAGIIALAEYTAGSVPRAREAADRAAGLVDGLSDEELAARLDAVVWLGWVEMFLARAPAALRHQQRALLLARERGLSYLLTHLLVGQGSAYKWLGRLPEALRCFEEAREVALLTGSEQLLTMALTMLARVHTWLGNLETARRLGQEAVDRAGLRADWFAALAPVILAQARVEAGDADGCERAVVRAGGGADLPRIDPASRSDWYVLLTRAAVLTGDLDAATTWAQRAQKSAGSLGEELGEALPAPSAFALLAEAEVLAASGSAQDAAARAQQAAEALTDLANPLDAGRARLLAGGSLAAAGQRAAALAELTAARDAFARCSASALHDRTVRELRRLGHRVPAPASGRAATRVGDLLTAREAEVAALVARGRTNREIAAALFLSEKTVERHLSHLFLKLEVTSRAAVAARVAQDAASPIPAGVGVSPDARTRRPRGSSR